MRVRYTGWQWADEMVHVEAKDAWDSGLDDNITVLKNDSELEPAVLRGRGERGCARSSIWHLEAIWGNSERPKYWDKHQG